MTTPTWPTNAWPFGTLVEKISGSEWSGWICGWYKTKQTPLGYCVKSNRHRNSVQIFPASALRKLEATT